MRPTLALIGCGKMGQALLTGWLNDHLAFDITVIQPDPLPADIKMAGFTFSPHRPSEKVFDIIIFAVKPQILDTVCADYKEAVHDDTLILSIAAGKDIASFAAVFGRVQPIIRTMPNTPAAIGKGITALAANAAATPAHKAMAETLFTSCGTILWLDDEAQMNAVTAISGSGPAYLFYFIEALTKSAESLGLERVKAAKFARETVIGAAALAGHEPETPASKLRQNVKSPGGTTAAALDILMDGRWQDILNNAVHAAKQRGTELN